MEESEFDDILDDWFIESLKTYKDLFVYQLEGPSRVIEWTSRQTVCVAGCTSSKNEILELRLPQKLFATGNKGLCAERDFKVVHGGFTDGPVCCLRHVPGTRCVVTNDGRSSDLQVWDLGGDDGETESADPLSSLSFVSDAVFLAGCCNGNVYIADMRTSAAPQLSPPPASSGESVLWWTDASTGLDPSSCRIVRLSSSGQAVISDLRIPAAAVSRAQLDVPTRHCNLDDVQVSWSPALDGCIAVSGFSGAVQIYNTSVWGAEPQEARPLFEHRGHAVSPQSADGVPVFVASHVWHPERPRTLLSAASDGSVHVWDWVDRSAAIC
uniref:WD repeat-containing protein 73 isoform X2 n=1 Tax=Scatophagus argus TaxID=75038 RepID=UPI001ED85F9D|nr:WD repeat-containing protein 73 isoform X2 [Scatophagus argus]